MRALLGKTLIGAVVGMLLGVGSIVVYGAVDGFQHGYPSCCGRTRAGTREAALAGALLMPRLFFPATLAAGFGGVVLGATVGGLMIPRQEHRARHELS